MGGNVTKITPEAPEKPGPAPKVGAAQHPAPTKNLPNRPAMTPPKVLPVAEPARLRRRHFGLMASFFLMVVAPLALSAAYLWIAAQDRYASMAGFTVRSAEGGSASGLIGGIAQLTGSNTSVDGDILYEFILSQNLVADIDADLDIVSHYSAPYASDPVFALAPDPTIEELTDYWGRIVRVSHDSNSGLIDLRVLAYSPEMAQAISQAIVDRSQEEINALNAQAREDATRYALEDLTEAQERLRRAREALTQFRVRTQIVDPEADLQGRLGVMGNLQEQLVQALIEFDLLKQTAPENDPRTSQAELRIDVIRSRIAEERNAFAGAGESADGQDYPALIAEYEGLVVDREVTEETYRVSLTAVDLARANAQRESRYLATFIRPTLAQEAEYPQRWVLVSMTGLFLLLTWSIGALIFYSIRDRG